jgi:uncharacterized membrane protein YgdD (TMEM256/DUF423 family)
MAKIFLALAALAGGTAVALGAFAAHGLKSRLGDALLNAFRTGVDYQFYHALALLAVALLLRQAPAAAGPWLPVAGWLFAAGILLFCGSLYGLALLDWKWLGPVTPLGGLAFIAGWLCLLIGVLRLP